MSILIVIFALFSALMQLCDDSRVTGGVQIRFVAYYRFFVFIFKKVKKICNWLKRVFYAAFEKLEQIVLKSLQNTSNFLIMTVKTAKKLLQYIHKLLYTKRNNVNVENKLDETKTKT